MIETVKKAGYVLVMTIISSVSSAHAQGSTFISEG